MQPLLCETCGKAARAECACGACYCNEGCQKIAWQAGHSAMHISGNGARDLFRTISNFRLKQSALDRNLYRQTYNMGKALYNADFDEPLVESPLSRAGAKLAAAIVERVVQRRLSRNDAYQFEQKSILTLLRQMHDAFHRLAYYWSLKWGLHRRPIVQLAFLLEDAVEDLFVLGQAPPIIGGIQTTRTDLYIALLGYPKKFEETGRLLEEGSQHEPGDLEVLATSEFDDRIPDNNLIAEIHRQVLQRRPFMPDTIVRGIAKLIPGIQFKTSKFLLRGNWKMPSGKTAVLEVERGVIAHAWDKVLRALAFCMIYTFSSTFRARDIDRASPASQIAFRTIAIQNILLEPLMRFGDAILQERGPQAAVDAQVGAEESDEDELEL